MHSTLALQNGGHDISVTIAHKVFLNSETKYKYLSEPRGSRDLVNDIVGLNSAFYFYIFNKKRMQPKGNKWGFSYLEMMEGLN